MPGALVKGNFQLHVVDLRSKGVLPDAYIEEMQSAAHNDTLHGRPSERIPDCGGGGYTAESTVLDRLIHSQQAMMSIVGDHRTNRPCNAALLDASSRADFASHLERP